MVCCASHFVCIAKTFTFEAMAKTALHKPVHGHKEARATAPKRNSQNPWHSIAIVMLLLSTWLSYHDNLQHTFHFDDLHAIINNKSIQNMDQFKDAGYWANPNNRPLSYYTFALNYASGKLDTTPYHITNIIIHMVAGLFFYFLILKMFSARVMRSHALHRYRVFIAFLAAAVLVLHPVQTQSVTYIVQRMASMAWTFGLASILAYLHGRLVHTGDGGTLKRALPWYGLAALAYLAALLSKQSAAPLPLIMLAAEYIFISRKDGKPYMGYVIGSLSAMAAAVIVILALGVIPPEKGALDPLTYFATQMSVILKYLQLSLIPVNLTLDYNYPVTASWLNVRFIIPFLIHLSLFAIAFLVRKRQPLISMGIFLFYLPLALTSTIFPIRDVIFEQRMYLSVGGFALVMASLMFMLYARKPQRILLIIPVVWLGILGYATFERNKVWKDPCTIWEDTLEKSQGNSRAWNAVGDCYKQQENFDKAMEYYDKAMLLDSTNTTALNNRGNVKLLRNDYEGAIRDYSTIIAISPEASNLAFMNRGIAYMRLGQHLRAKEDFTRVIKSGTAEANAYFHRAVTLVYLGDYPSAEKDLEIVLKEEPNNQDALFNMASVKMNTDQLGDAIQYFSRIITYNPNHAASYHYRGVAYLNLGMRAEACSDLQQAANRQYPPSAAVLQKYCNQQVMSL
jgi:protein O-mannosyl-transferase